MKDKLEMDAEVQQSRDGVLVGVVEIGAGADAPVFCEFEAVTGVCSEAEAVFLVREPSFGEYVVLFFRQQVDLVVVGVADGGADVEEVAFDVERREVDAGTDEIAGHAGVPHFVVASPGAFRPLARGDAQIGAVAPPAIDTAEKGGDGAEAVGKFVVAIAVAVHDHEGFLFQHLGFCRCQAHAQEEGDE